MARDLDIHINVNADEASAQLAQVDGAVEHVGQTAERSGGALEGLFSGIASGISAGVIIQAVRQTAEWASALERMKVQTGFATEALQEYAYAARLAGVPIETLTTGVSMLERRLASDPKSVNEALKSVGISLGDIRNNRPEDIFNKISESVMRVEDPLKRAQAAQELFGRGGSLLLPVMENLDEVRQKAHDMGAVMDESAVAAMGRLNAALDTARSRVTVLIAEGMTPLVDRFTQLQSIIDGISHSDNRVLNLLGMFAGGTAAVVKTPLNLASGAAGLAGGAMDVVDVLLNGAGGAPKAPKAPGLAMPNQAGVRLDPNDEKQLAVLEAAEHRITNEVRDKVQLEREFEESLKRQRSEFDSILRAVLDINKEYDKHLAAKTEASDKQFTAGILGEYDARKGNMARFGLNPDGTPLGFNDPMKQYQNDVDSININSKTADGRTIPTDQRMQEASGKFTDAILADAKAADALFQSHTDAANAGEQLSRAHAGAVVAADAATQAFMRFSGVNVSTAGSTDLRQRSIIDTIAGGGQYTENEASAIAAGIFVNSTAGRQRAAGGPVNAGEPYLVGERGPELFTPGQSGNITANGAGGGVAVGDIHIHGNVDSEKTARALADQVAERLMRKFKQQSRLPYGKN